MRPIDNVNVTAIRPLVTPRRVKEALPVTERAGEVVYAGRDAICRILNGGDDRLLGIVGPCSIHDREAALDYAERLRKLSDEVGDRVFLVMRAYFEKPRTTLGWKGLINDPHLDGSGDINEGLHAARRLLLELADMGLPAATEVLDPIVPQYLSDLVTWAAIGARTTESQTHREMASGLSMPVGFKNGTDGNLRVAVNAMLAARGPHHFLGIDQDGSTCVVETKGNPWGHLILRGGGGRPNYDPVSLRETEEYLLEAGLNPLVVVDCSHENSGKRPELQPEVLDDVVRQRLKGTATVRGFMLESNLVPGNQRVSTGTAGLTYGQSITDPCLGWEKTAAAIRSAHRMLK